MPKTEAIARAILKTEQKCRVIMEQARKREAVFLQKATETPGRKEQFKKRAAQQIQLAEQLCGEMMERARRIKNKSAELTLKKLLGE